MLRAVAPARVASSDQATCPAMGTLEDVTKVGYVPAHVLASLRRPLPADVRDRLPTEGTLDHWLDSIQIPLAPRPRTRTLPMALPARSVVVAPPPIPRQRISTPSPKKSFAPWILPIVAAIAMFAGAGYVCVHAWSAIPATGDWSEP
jgi:hypothetical protein